MKDMRTFGVEFEATCDIRAVPRITMSATMIIFNAMLLQGFR